MRQAAALAGTLLLVAGTVRAEVPRSRPTCTVPPPQIACGSRATGSLLPSDCTFASGTDTFRYDLWTLHLPAGQRANLFLDTVQDRFNPRLAVYRPDGSLAATGADYRSDEQTDVLDGIFDPGGEWTVLVTSSDPLLADRNYRLDVTCTPQPDPASLDLWQGRFDVQVDWANQYDGSRGRGVPGRFTDAAGYFTFGNPENIELLVKILDFGGGDFKVFYGQLTDLNFQIVVRDRVTGKTKTYRNGPGNCGAIDPAFVPAKAGAIVELEKKTPTGGAAACVAGPKRMCLLDNRYRVELDWRNQYNGQSGRAYMKALSRLTGTATYDDPRNIELVVKLLDFGDRVLLFYGALSDLQYTVIVTDTTTGRVRRYQNPPGRFCGGSDTLPR